MKYKHIAIVYDWIDSWGGVERLLLILQELYPYADFYTSYYDKNDAPWAQHLNIYPSFLQKLPRFIRKSRILSLPLYPYAFESFNLSKYDLVISVTSAFAKSVITKPSTKHLCYLLTPPRYLWGMTDQYTNVFGSTILKSLREKDYISAQRPDKIISISQVVANRCFAYYNRKSDVLFPPFDLSYWQAMKSELRHCKPPIEGEYHLVVSRLEPYKNIELPLMLFNKTQKRLVIIGKGRLKSNLMRMAGTNITFVENITDTELARWYIHAQALIMPQEEDFGYVALEAQSMGCPVVAYAKGGALETIHNNSGVFFASQSEESLQEALERLKLSSYNGNVTLQAVEPFLETFSKNRFLKRLQSQISDIL